jgi:hypothetical protein
MMKENAKTFMKYNILCKSLGGSLCPIVTITNDIESYFDYKDELKI